MKWHILSSMFFLATFKYMLAPMPGAQSEIPFLETIISVFIGGALSSTFFFFGSEAVIIFSRNRRLKKDSQLISKGLTPPIKKKFTRTNKFILRIKNLFGIWGICMFAPVLMSIPIGSIVAAKFYSDDKKAYPIILVGLIFNALALSMIWYAIL